MRRTLRGAQRLFERPERRQVAVIPTHVAQLGTQAVERFRIVNAAGLFEAVLHVFVQLRQAPFRPCHAHHRHIENLAFGQCVERGKDHLVREVTARAENDQCVGGHHAIRGVVHFDNSP